MPTLSPSHYRRAVQPGVRGTGVVKAASLDYTDDLVTADVALLRTQFVEAGIDWLDSTTFDSTANRLTFHFVTGRQRSFDLIAHSTTRYLYYGGTETVPSMLAQADLDAMSVIEEPNLGGHAFDITAPAGSSNWYAYVLVSVPQSLTGLNVNTQTIPSSVPAAWIPTPPQVTINNIVYRIYYTQRTDMNPLDMGIILDPGP